LATEAVTQVGDPSSSNLQRLGSLNSSYSRELRRNFLGAIVNAKKKEANQMPSPRWLARLSIPMIAGAALVASAAIATADATNDAYLAQLRALGFTFSPDRDEAVIAVAHLICYDRRWGLTPDAIAQDVHTVLGPRGLTFGDVTSMVGLAESTYCPG
jgi:Protein of unknown function (DUF732)